MYLPIIILYHHYQYPYCSSSLVTLQKPKERMDLELAYAHGRVLSLKRLLGHKHISHRRIRTSLEHGKDRVNTWDFRVGTC